MQRVSGGYTIIEVTIVLAVSVALLAMSMTFLSGREGHTRFSQSMRDMQSKMQDWLNDVSTGNAGGVSGTNIGDIHCKLAGSLPQIKNTGSPPGDPDCIFLGKAIQFTDKNSPPTADQDKKIYVYSVFGRRVLGSGDPVGSLLEANPVPATGLGANGNQSFTEEYNIQGGTKVKSITDGSGGTSHMAGFYLSFNQLAANKNGSQDIRSYQYNLSSNQIPANASGGDIVNNCVQLRDPCAGTPASLTNWQICFENDSNNDTAVLSVTSNNGLGVSTNLEFKAC